MHGDIRRAQSRLQGAEKGLAAAAHDTSQKQRYLCEVLRAKAAVAEAVLRRQSAKRRRRTEKLAELDFETSEAVSAWLKPKKKVQVITEAIWQQTSPDGGTKEVTETTDEGVHRAFTETWSPVFQMPWEDTPDVRREMAEVLEEISREVGRE